jgi:hypothetical protein
LLLHYPHLVWYWMFLFNLSRSTTELSSLLTFQLW